MTATTTPSILDRRILHDEYLTVTRLTLKLRDGSEVSREVASHGDAAAVLPYDDVRGVALTVRLMRPPVLVAADKPELQEACAGMIEDGRGADETARREAFEELGVVLGPLEPAGVVWSSPGVSTEKITLFLAPYGARDRQSDGGGAAGEHENIDVCEVALSQLARAADSGEMTDAKLLMLTQTLRLRRPELFASQEPPTP